jgi:hypothetical protein
LRFFWLSVTSFGLFTFSFSGRLDRLDWIFLLGRRDFDPVAARAVFHFALVFPGAAERRRPADAS